MKTIRLDKLLSHAGHGTRSQVRGLILTKRVLVDGVVCKNFSLLLDENHLPNIVVDDVPVKYQKMHLLVMNKPEGVLTAARDKKAPTVMDFLPEHLRSLGVMPVGRLDKDTTGLLLFTNDGELAHRLMSPKNKVQKVYVAHLDKEPMEGAAQQFAQGMDLGDFVSKPAELTMLSPLVAKVTVTEGKFHQVKRMLEKVGSQVLALHRESYAGVVLNPALQPGQYEEVDAQKTQQLYELVEMNK